MPLHLLCLYSLVNCLSANKENTENQPTKPNKTETKQVSFNHEGWEIQEPIGMGSLLLYPFTRIIVLGSSLGPMIHLGIFGLVNTVSHGFFLIERALNPRRRWLFYSSTCATIAQVNIFCQASHYCSSPESQLAWTTVYFSPLVACIAPSSTIKGNQQHWSFQVISTSLSSPSPKTQVCGFLSNRLLPSTSGWLKQKLWQ